jgi:Holliday junction resolvase RusA-like endonuclease
VNPKNLPDKYKLQIANQVAEQNRRQRERGKVLTYPLVISLETELRSLNEYTGETGHYGRAERKDDFRLHFKAHKYFSVKPPEQKQFVTITRFYGDGQRPFDDDNLAGGDAKELLDVMTEIGFWQDDSPTYIKTDYKQDKAIGKPFTRIEISLEVNNEKNFL